MADDLDTVIREYAEAGGICEVCAGVHQKSIGLALRILHSRKHGLVVPTCTCESCEVCAPLRKALMRHAKKEKPQ